MVATETGTALFNQTYHLTTALYETFNDIKSANQSVSGTLKLMIPDIPALGSVISSFATSYPDISICCDTSLHPQVSLQDGYDVILNFNRGKLADKNWIAKKLRCWQSVVVASPDLIDKVGRPSTIQELGQLPCISTTTALNGTPWKFKPKRGHRPITVSVKSQFRVNSGNMAMNAAVSGIGFAILAQEACQAQLASSALQIVALDHQPLDLELYAYYSSKSLQPPKISAFLNYIEQEMV